MMVRIRMVKRTKRAMTSSYLSSPRKSTVSTAVPSSVTEYLKTI